MEEQAGTLARSWIDAWNAHDLERVLDNFSDHVTFTSPLVTTVMGDPSGTVTGKDELRADWRAGLDRNPDLQFTLDHLFGGVDTVAIASTTQNGRAWLETGIVGSDGRFTCGGALYG